MDTIDPKIKNLVTAIGRAETGDHSDPYNATGASGEFGRYQFMPSTWQQWAPEFGVDVNDHSVAAQNIVAYNKVKQWKEQGLNPAQIASKWNSGDENKYKQGWKGVNEFGVAYDTPAYAMKVSNYYKELSGTQKTPEEVAKDVISSKTPTPGGFMGKVADFVGGGKLAQGIGQTIYNVTEGEKTIDDTTKQLIDTQTNILNKIKEKKSLGEDTSRLEKALEYNKKALEDYTGQTTELLTGGLTDKEVIGSSLQLAATAIPGLGKGAPLLAKVGVGAGTGYLYDVGSKLQDNNKTLKEQLTPGLGTALGASLPIVGTIINKIVDKLPRSIVQSKLKGIKPENADEFLSRPYGTIKDSLIKSQKAVDSIDDQISSVLKHPIYENEVGMIDDIADTVRKSFPESEVLAKDDNIFRIIKSVAPKNSKIVEKIKNGVATIEEQNILRKEIDRAVSKFYTSETPKLTFSKDVARIFGNALRENVQTFSGTEELFANFAKELNIRNGLLSAVKKMDKQELLNLYDIASLATGGLPAMIAEKAVRGPSAQIGLAKTVSGITKATTSKTGKLLRKAGEKILMRSSSGI